MRLRESWLGRRLIRFRRTVVPRLPLPSRFALWYLRRDNEARSRANRWAHLADVDDLGRYSLIRGYCDHYRPNDTILDVGCGDGILQSRLDYGRYLGVELFAEPIERMTGHDDDRTRFVRADAEDYEPTERFDAIIFNECLIYMDDPVATVHRLEQHLEDDGIVIVSMWNQLHRARRIFRKLLEDRTLLARSVVTNLDGMSWTVTVHRPPAGGRATPS